MNVLIQRYTSENSLAVLPSVKYTVIFIWYDPAIPLLGMYPKQQKPGVQTKICPWILTAVIVAPTWKQPK